MEYTKRCHQADDRLNARLTGRLAIGGHEIRVDLSLNGERRVVKPLESFGKIHDNYGSDRRDCPQENASKVWPRE